jgi:predicted type IV restriction endonuclease
VGSKGAAMHPDDGYNNFVKLFDAYNEKAHLFNEADTRAKIIDAILRECLGWSEANIRREEITDSGRIDYKLVYQDVPLLVIEAKKAGEYFEIPKNMTNRRYKLRGAIETVSNLAHALEQAKRYCDDIGCKYAAVSNGYQLVIFSAITLGKNWKDGYCYVFHSLADIKSNFSQFWNMLAYDQVISQASLINYLEKGKRELSFEKSISAIYNPDQCWARNRLYSQIKPISNRPEGQSSTGLPVGE